MAAADELEVPGGASARTDDRHREVVQLDGGVIDTDVHHEVRVAGVETDDHGPRPGGDAHDGAREHLVDGESDVVQIFERDSKSAASDATIRRTVEANAWSAGTRSSIVSLSVEVESYDMATGSARWSSGASISRARGSATGRMGQCGQCPTTTASEWMVVRSHLCCPSK